MTWPSRTLLAMPHLLRATLAPLLGTIALVLAMPGVAGAQTASFSITPTDHQPYFILNLRPGTVVLDRVRVTNVTSTTGQVQLFGVDATTGQTSGAVYLSQSAPRRDVGKWIALSTHSLTLGPHQSAVVSFTVRVPRGVRAGQHLGGLVAAPLAPVSTHVTHRAKSVFRVQIHEIAVVGVLVNLPGPQVQRLQITGVSASGHPGYQTLLIGLANPGDTLLKGAGRIAVDKLGAGAAVSRSFALDTFVPQTRIQYPLYLRRRLAAGRYRARIEIVYGRQHRVTGTFVFSIAAGQLRKTYGSTAPAGLGGSPSSSSPPVWLIALGALALIAASVAGSAFYFRARSRRTGPQLPPR
jgi:hypothetical protein